MNVTRDVILDLWPMYEAGEASGDTKALVESYLAGDKDLAGLLRRASEAAARGLNGRAHASPAADGERRVVAETRRRLGRQRWLTGAAVFVTLLPFSFADLGNGVHLLIVDPGLRTLIWVAAAALWGTLWRVTRR